jgi:hypothetical protein
VPSAKKAASPAETRRFVRFICGGQHHNRKPILRDQSNRVKELLEIDGFDDVRASGNGEASESLDGSICRTNFAAHARTDGDTVSPWRLTIGDPQTATANGNLGR